MIENKKPLEDIVLNEAIPTEGNPALQEFRHGEPVKEKKEIKIYQDITLHYAWAGTAKPKVVRTEPEDAKYIYEIRNAQMGADRIELKEIGIVYKRDNYDLTKPHKCIVTYRLREGTTKVLKNNKKPNSQ